MAADVDFLDDLDRRILQALTSSPRSPFRTLADAVGVSDQTVARRYRRLCDLADLRVIARIEGSRIGWVDWYLRLRCSPGSALSIGEALASRSDTLWVHLAAAGTEIVCVLQARSARARDALLLENLPGSRHVVQVSAHQILNEFSEQWVGLRGALGPTAGAGGGAEVASAPVPPSPAEPSQLPVKLAPGDDTLLDCLLHDGRASLAELAAATNWHESTVRRRIGELTTSGVLHFEVEMDSRSLGVTTLTILWLGVEPSQLEAVGRAVASHPEVAFVAATTGQTNLLAVVLCRDSDHLYRYLTGRLSRLSGIRDVESAPIIRTLKRHGSLRPAGNGTQDGRPRGRDR